MIDINKTNKLNKLIDIHIYSNQTMLINELLKLSVSIDGFGDIFNECDEDGHYVEVFQWLLVSEYLVDVLMSKNEPVIKNGYGNWWGRTVYGQSLYMDAVLNEISNER